MDGTERASASRRLMISQPAASPSDHGMSIGAAPENPNRKTIIASMSGTTVRRSDLGKEYFGGQCRSQRAATLPGVGGEAACCKPEKLEWARPGNGRATAQGMPALGQLTKSTAHQERPVFPARADILCTSEKCHKQSLRPVGSPKLYGHVSRQRSSSRLCSAQRSCARCGGPRPAESTLSQKWLCLVGNAGV